MDNLFEPSKKFFTSVTAIFSLACAGLSFVTYNSKFLTPCVCGPLSTFIYQIVLALGFILLSLYSFNMAGVINREKKYIKLMASFDDYRGFYEEKKYQKKLKNAEKSRKNARNFAKIIGILAVACFLFVFTMGEVLYMISEITKPEIDRVVGDKDFRIFTDLITYFCFDLSIIGFIISIPHIIRNRSVNKIVVILFMVTAIVSLVHFTYFCMGNFTNYPSLIDGGVAALSLLFAIIGYLSLKTENKKKTFANWSEVKYNIYDF